MAIQLTIKNYYIAALPVRLQLNSVKDSQPSPEDKAFYLALGFEVSPLQPMMLMATLANIEAAIIGT